jgi:hypothetical protein
MNILHKLQQLLAICLFCGLALLSIACKEDKPEPSVEQKKVTGLNMVLTSDEKGVADVTVDFNDAGGLAGKTSPNAITLDDNATYTGSLALEDATQNPPKSVTGDYQVTFQVTNANATFNMSAQVLQVTTGAASTGTSGMLHVELKRDGQTQKVSFPLMVRQ